MDAKELLNKLLTRNEKLRNKIQSFANKDIAEQLDIYEEHNKSLLTKLQNTVINENNDTLFQIFELRDKQLDMAYDLVNEGKIHTAFNISIHLYGDINIDLSKHNLRLE